MTTTTTKALQDLQHALCTQWPDELNKRNRATYDRENALRYEKAKTAKQGRTWRRLFPTYAEHGVTRTMVPVEVRIVRDTEWDEYRCELWSDGAHLTHDDYHTDDTADALNTGAAMLRIKVAAMRRLMYA